MTPFEIDSLKLAQDMLVSSRWQAIAAIAITLVTGIAAFIGVRTLRELVRQVRLAAEANSIAQLNALLVLEQDMSQRRIRLAEVGQQMHTMQKSDAYKFDGTILQPVIIQFNEAVESYLNSLDRLSFCILRNKFSEDELRADYRDVVKAAIRDNPDQFGAATPFRNVRKLHELWADT